MRRRNPLMLIGVIACIGILILTWVFASATPTRVVEAEPQRELPPEPVVEIPKEEPESTPLSEVEVVNMVRILRTAILKGDTATRDAMIEGIREEPEFARRAINREIARCSEQQGELKQALEEALKRIE